MISLMFGDDGTYSLSTDSSEAAFWFSPTHLAPLSMARVTLAAAAGFSRASRSLTTVTQQYSSLYGSSRSWSATASGFTTPSPMNRVPSGSASATAWTSPFFKACSSAPPWIAFQWTSGESLRGIDPVGGEDAGGEHVRRAAERRGDADGLALEVFHRFDVRFDAGLDAEAARVDAAGDLHVKVFFDPLEQVHEQRVVGVELAGAEARLQADPIRLHQLDVEALFLEEALLLGREDRRLAGQADVGDLELDRRRRVVGL